MKKELEAFEARLRARLEEGESRLRGLVEKMGASANGDALLSYAEVRRILGLGKTTLAVLVANRVILAVRGEGQSRPRIPRSEVDRYIAEAKQRALDESSSRPATSRRRLPRAAPTSEGAKVRAVLAARKKRRR